MPPRKYSPKPNGEPKRSFSSRNSVSSATTCLGSMVWNSSQTPRIRSAASSMYASVSEMSASNCLRISFSIFSRSSSESFLRLTSSVSAQRRSSSEKFVCLPVERYSTRRSSDSFSSSTRSSRSAS